MSDSLYRPEDRNQIRLKAKGILQFGNSTLDRVGKSIHDRPVKAKKRHINLDEVNT